MKEINLHIRYLGDPILRKKTEKVEKITPEFSEFLEVFFSQMYKLDGIGLAAPQLGISLSFFVMDDGERKRTVINPEIKSFGKEEITFEEGCLSVPEIYADIVRPREISVKYTNELGEIVEENLTDQTARIFQHEFDHLEGILFTDKLSVVQKARLKKQLQKIIKDGKKIAKEIGEIKL